MEKKSIKAIENRLFQIKENNLYREINYIEGPQEKFILLEGKKLLLMASNNYLNLANRKELQRAAIEGINKYGFGSGGSRLTTGSYKINKLLEDRLAEFFNKEGALVFNSGYAANTGTIAAICDSSFTIYSDELNHASIIDGSKLAKAKTIVFKHNDIKDLKEKLKLKETENAMIITESVFSMDGDIANIPEFIKVANEFEALLMVDDAHGIGVIGEKGKGILEYYNVNEEVDIYIGTLSKAIGSEGGFVAAKKEIIEFLKNKARPFIFSTAISMSAIAASLKSLEIIEKEFSLVKKLQDNIIYLNKELKKIGVESNSNSAIIPILIGDEKKAVNISKYLKEKGIYLSAIRYPTVKRGKAILRVCLMSNHDKTDIDYLIEMLRKAFRIFNVEVIKA